MSAAPGAALSIAFLGGVNLGRRRVSNEELRRAFERIGLPGAATFRASGNVIFDGAGASTGELEELVESRLDAELGWAVTAWVRSGPEVRAIAGAEPFSAEQLAATAGRVQVCMLRAAPTARAGRDAVALGGESDRLALGARELFWLPASGISDSPLDTRALRELLGPMTVRTLGTVREIAARHL